jgi:hypothetical protein
MKTIWKFPLDITDTQDVTMPMNTEILCIQIQNERPCIWAIVNPKSAFKELRTIITRGTGHPVSEMTGKYIGTYQIDSGSLVFHVFEKQEG